MQIPGRTLLTLHDSLQLVVNMSAAAARHALLASSSSATVPQRPGILAMPALRRPAPSCCSRRAGRMAPLVPQAACGGSAATTASATVVAAAVAKQEVLVSQLFAASTVYALVVAALVSFAGSCPPVLC